MENYIDTLIKKAEESLNEALKESRKVGKHTTTNLINTEFNMGKFHAYIDLLEDIDINIFVEVVEKNKVKCDEVLCNIQNAY